jgi:hypothetical protein
MDKTSNIYVKLLNKYRNSEEWEHVGSGQNGAVYARGNEAVKITTDEYELQHAKKVEGKQFASLAPIWDVELVKPDLGTYKMPLLQPVPADIAEKVDSAVKEIGSYLETGDEKTLIRSSAPGSIKRFFIQVRKDFIKAGIPLDEHDISGDNIMVAPNGTLKLIDY